MARLAEVIGFLTTLPNVPVFMFAYLFPCKITIIVCVEILGNKKMLALVECLDSYFLKYQQLYQQEVFPKIVFQIFQLVFPNKMVCLSIFDRKVLMYVFLVSPIHGSWLYSWNILSAKIRSVSRIIFLTRCSSSWE